jgi:hypothetical protein
MPDLHSRRGLEELILERGTRRDSYGAVVLMSASAASAVVASFYVVISLVLGYIAVAVGLKLGGQGSA